MYKNTMPFEKIRHMLQKNGFGIAEGKKGILKIVQERWAWMINLLSAAIDAILISSSTVIVAVNVRILNLK